MVAQSWIEYIIALQSSKEGSRVTTMQ